MLITINKLAEITGIDRRVVTRTLDMLPPEQMRANKRLFCSKKALKLLYAMPASEDKLDLTAERAREARASATLKELEIERVAGRMVEVSAIESDLAAWVIAIRNEIESGIGRLVAEVERRHGITIAADFVERFIEKLLNKLAAPGLGTAAVVIDQVDDD